MRSSGRSLAILAGQAVAFLLPRGDPAALVAAWLGSVPLLVTQLTIIEGVFNGLNIRLAPFLMIPVVLTAAALVPVAAQALDRRDRRAAAQRAESRVADTMPAATIRDHARWTGRGPSSPVRDRPWPFLIVCMHPSLQGPRSPDFFPTVSLLTGWSSFANP